MIPAGELQRESEDKRSRKGKHKKVKEGRERVEVFDDTAGVYRAK